MNKEPFDVAGRFLAALDRAEWDTAASLVDGADLEEWYVHITRDRSYKGKAITADDIRAHDPDMPMEAAVYAAAKAQADLARRGSSLHGDFGPVRTVEELRRVARRKALGLFLRMLDPAERYSFETGEAKPDLGLKRNALACIQPRASTAYVLYEDVDVSGGVAAEVPKVVVMRYGDEGWRVRLRADPFQSPGYTLMGMAKDGDGGDAQEDRERTDGL